MTLYTESNDLLFGANNVLDYMILTAGGNVGIGTTGPLDKLHVNGEARVLNCVRNSGGTQIAGTCPSDTRLKKNIVPFSVSLDKVAALQPVTFDWRAEEYPERGFGSERSYGLIAQEVEKILPELVTEDEKGYKAVNYSKLPLYTIQAVKELKAENDELRERVQKLEELLEQRLGVQVSQVRGE